ncbi:splicing factor [Dipsacomyces acuminosporus]|nr:splicing factor [Dipsacomyces acuminosporus]
MSEEIDVEALLDAPFKRGKEVDDENNANAAGNGKVVETKANSTLAKPDTMVSTKTAYVESEKRREKDGPSDGAEGDGVSKHHRRTASPHEYSRSKSRSRSRSRPSRSRHRSRRGHADGYDDEGYDDIYGRDSAYRRQSHRSSSRRHRRGESRDPYDDEANGHSRYEDRERSHRDDDRDYYRDYDRRRYDRRSRSRSRSVADDHGRKRRRGSNQSASRSPSPAVVESERDLRTVFAMQLSARLRRSDLVDFFGKAGRVRDAHIVAEKGSRRSRGVAYIEFYTIESAIKAVGLSGQRLLGVPIIVQPSEAEKNRQPSMRQYSATGVPLHAASSTADAASGTASNNTLVYLGNLLVDMEVDDLKLFFDQFGQVEWCHIENIYDSDADGSKVGDEWVAFAKYTTPASAQLCVEKLSGFKLFGAKLHARLSSRSEREREQKRIEKQSQPAVQEPQGSVDTAPAVGSPNGDKHDGAVVAAAAAAVANTASVDSPENNDDATVAKSVALLLSNMFDPKDEASPNWASELEEDVKEECSKFGEVQHVVIDPISHGNIYLTFAGADSADLALQSLNRRWFAGRQISATLVSTERFEEALALASSTNK